MVEVPIISLTIGYNQIFGEPVPKTREDRLELIKHIPKVQLIHELASLNYRLRPYYSLDYSSDSEQQKEELLYFCGGDENLYYSYFSKILFIAKQQEQKGGQVVIFYRPANLFALQEIINFGSNLEPDGFNMWQVWDNILRYYLAVNDKVSAYLPEEEIEFNSFEKLSAGQLFMNNLQVVNNPFLSFERFILIVDYFKNSSEFSRYFADFFRPAGFDPAQYLYAIVNLYVHLKDRNEYYGYLYEVPPKFQEDLKILNLLSNRGEFQQRHNYDLTNIKKYPFYKESDNRFILIDLGILIDKAYHLFIYDFFFDYLKPNGFTYDYYAGKVGLFFEEYISHILTKSFFRPQVIIKTLNQLKTSALGDEDELADFYIREGHKVILGQVKASGLNTEQNEGLAESLFRGSKNFYKDFGLLQIVKSLKCLRDIPKEYEAEIPNGPLEVFPVIVLNDTLSSTPLIPILFQKELERLLADQQFQGLIIKPLTLINIQDLELLGYTIQNNNENIWQVLTANFEGSLFPRPFRVTLNRLGIHHGSYDYSTLKIAKYVGIE